MKKTKTILAQILNPQNDRQCDFFVDGAIQISCDEKNQWRIDGVGLQEEMNITGEVLDYSQHLMLPGFYDMHFHWVQDDVRLQPKDSLLEWLENYTFPAEARFANPDYSYQKAKSFFQSLTRTGTIGGACYSSIHGHALDHAFEFAQGDFVIGNVLMTMNSPSELTQSSSEAQELIATKADQYRHRYALTPRFAPTTDPATMKYGAQMAQQHKCFTQTHLAETTAEIDYVLAMYRQIPGFEDVQSYTEIYDRCQLLGSQTLMGHGIYLSESEWNLLAKTKTAIIHCPTSNAPIEQNGLGSGLFDIDQAAKYQVKWALGSDIGAGPYVSMLDVMNSFYHQHSQAHRNVSYTRALYRSTLAGAQLLGLDQHSGNFAPDKFFNAVILPCQRRQGSAEGALRTFFDSYQGGRESFDSAPLAVFYRGQELFLQS